MTISGYVTDKNDFNHSFNTIVSYGHVITNGIGFDSASLEAPANPDQANYYLGMIGKRLTITSRLGLIWSGFINQIGIGNGIYYATIGPLVNMANKITVGYTDYDNGEKSFTSPISDLGSIDRYGTFYKVINGGKIPSSLAADNAAIALEERRFPEVTDTFQQDQSATVKIDALGFGHMLKEYPYNNASSGTAYSHAIVQAVLEAQPDSVFSTDYSRFMTTTTLSFETLQEDYKTADTVIQDAIEIGNDNNLPISFGIYEREKAWFVAPHEHVAELGYHHIPGENFVRDMAGRIIWPEFIRPGRTLAYSGILKRFGGREGFLGDGSTVIQGVTFSAPDQFTINGSTLQTLPQKLAKQRGF